MGPSWPLITILKEQDGDSYCDLLAFGASLSGTCSLVRPHQLEFGQRAAETATALGPVLVEERVTDKWPGTQLLGSHATVRVYKLAPAVMVVLLSSKRLYAWLAPDLPEDLAFYTSSGDCWLGSIAHEQDSFVDPKCIDLAELREAVPGLELEMKNAGRYGIAGDPSFV